MEALRVAFREYRIFGCKIRYELFLRTTHACLRPHRTEGEYLTSI